MSNFKMYKHCKYKPYFATVGQYITIYKIFRTKYCLTQAVRTCLRFLNKCTLCIL